jgi:ABC-2 type transport system permease protein
MQIATTATSYSRTAFLSEFMLMTARYTKAVIRNPGGALPSFLISVFTLLIYKESLGNAAAFLPGLTADSYIGFVVPLSVLSAALVSSSVAGSLIVSDISTGYFDKLLLTPVRRTVLLFSTMTVGVLVVGLQAIMIGVIGVSLGLNPPTGVFGIAFTVVIAVLVGNALAGFTLGIALRTGNPAATQATSLLFFPLTQLTAAFTPIELLGNTLRTLAQLNPITYVLSAMRTVLINGWGDVPTILIGIVVTVVFNIITFAFAYRALQARTRRK